MQSISWVGPRARFVLASAIALCASAVWRADHTSQARGGDTAVSTETTSGGAARCAPCHADVHARWSGARHSKMLQPATPATVLGDFSRGPVVLKGTRFTFGQIGDRFSVSSVFPTTRETVSRVDYTLGSRRVQHYLTTLPDGRIVVLPPTWDVERREWFHNLDIVNPLNDEASRNPVQVWNQHCLECHVSGGEKAYDPGLNRYRTRWTDFGTGCERCHGPAERHLIQERTQGASGAVAAMVVPTRLPADRSTMVCAQCHSLRDVTVPGFTAGSDYYDHFTPVLEYAQKPGPDPAYWPDGRPRRFSNDAIGVWQSRCYLDGGATCVTCHADPHAPNVDRHAELSRSTDAVCTTCHQTIARNRAQHSRHATGSAGASCLACHMPRTVMSLRSRMPDHTIGVPAPETTARFGIPNACTECHADRPASWAVDRFAEWYPNGRRRQLLTRAEAFTAARRKDPAAVDLLIGVARDLTQPPLARANAVGYLRDFPNPRVDAVLAGAAASEHAPLRMAAVMGFGAPGFSRAVAMPVLTHALSDARRVVRVGAAVSLVTLGVTRLDGQDGVRLDEARRDYVTRADLHADDAGVLFDVGKFHFLSQSPDQAGPLLESSLRLDARLQASRYFLALVRLAQGRVPDARQLLTAIPKDDPYGDSARQLLAKLPGR